jgi:hypothetical protein
MGPVFLARNSSPDASGRRGVDRSREPLHVAAYVEQLGRERSAPPVNSASPRSACATGCHRQGHYALHGGWHYFRLRQIHYSPGSSGRRTTAPGGSSLSPAKRWNSGYPWFYRFRQTISQAGISTTLLSWATRFQMINLSPAGMWSAVTTPKAALPRQMSSSTVGPNPGRRSTRTW